MDIHSHPTNDNTNVSKNYLNGLSFCSINILPSTIEKFKN